MATRVEAAAIDRRLSIPDQDHVAALRCRQGGWGEVGRRWAVRSDSDAPAEGPLARTVGGVDVDRRNDVSPAGDI